MLEMLQTLPAVPTVYNHSFDCLCFTLETEVCKALVLKIAIRIDLYTSMIQQTLQFINHLAGIFGGTSLFLRTTRSNLSGAFRIMLTASGRLKSSTRFSLI